MNKDSYLYSKMIPILNESGIRVIAPDLVGYGKSDKPSQREDYSYQNQVDWMNEWMINNNLKNLTFFGQDWGGLIGLRMIADNPDRFNKVSIGNTGPRVTYRYFIKSIRIISNHSQTYKSTPILPKKG